MFDFFGELFAKFVGVDDDKSCKKQHATILQVAGFGEVKKHPSKPATRQILQAQNLPPGGRFLSFCEWGNATFGRGWWQVLACGFHHPQHATFGGIKINVPGKTRLVIRSERILGRLLKFFEKWHV